MKFWLEKSDIEIYSTLAERLIRTLKNKIYKHVTSISKHVLLINWMK